MEFKSQKVEIIYQFSIFLSKIMRTVRRRQQDSTTSIRPKICTVTRTADDRSTHTHTHTYKRRKPSQ